MRCKLRNSFLFLSLPLAAMFCGPASCAEENPAVSPSKGFGHFELRPVRLAVDKIAPEVQQKFQETLSKLIDPTLMRWNEEGQQSQRTGTLAIEVTLTDMKFVSGAKRFWVGPLAGSSHSAGTVAYIDVASGRELARQTFTDASGAWAGSVTIGALDNRMISTLARQMADYVSQCGPVCFGDRAPEASQRQGAPVLASDPSGVSTIYDDLTKLDDLRKRGILTEQEFQEQKKALLDRQQQSDLQNRH